ncbi:ArsR family transcriptional regulator [Candidatus Parcubacteria bacterium]|nr:ArsR family transcriptional regulator [Candidatus Parcubacteria bacterium]
MNIILLKKLGLSDKEVKVYLGLLEYGASSVRSLSAAVGLNRGTVYDILKKLRDFGLVSYYQHKTKQKFIAEDPSKLAVLVEREEQRINKIKADLGSLIPELKSVQDKGGQGPTSKYYEGKSGIRLILEDVLKSVADSSKSEYYIYSATNASEDIYSAYPNFTKDRIKARIKVKAISLAKGGSTSGLDERRWLGTDEDSATFCLIYSGKLAYISRDNKGKPVGVIIENKMIYETQKIIFLQLWNLIKK